MDQDPYFNEVYQTIDDTFRYLMKKWNIKIIKAIFCDCRHFKDFQENFPTLSSKVLSQRLKELEEEGIIGKRVLNSTPVQTEYYLTEKGQRLNKILFELFNFALDEIMKNEPNELKKESKENLKVCLNIDPS